MNRLKTTLAVLILGCAQLAHASTDTKTLEQGCLWGISASSFTNVTSKTVDVMGYGSVGYSSITGNAFAFDYSIYAKGADATYQIVQTTKTPNGAAYPTNFNSAAPFDLAASVAVLSTSTVVTVPSGVVWPTRVGARMVNPVFYFTSLTAAATYYIQTTFCQQQKP